MPVRVVEVGDFRTAEVGGCEVGDEDIHPAGARDQLAAGAGTVERMAVGDYGCAFRLEQLHRGGPHVVRCLGDKHPFAEKSICHCALLQPYAAMVVNAGGGSLPAGVARPGLFAMR